MNKFVKYLFVGIILGILDVIPMILMKLTWDANISAFSMWIIISILLYYSNIKLHQVIKSIVLSFLVLLPNAILIGWNNPINLVPVIVMTLLLSTIMGLITKKFSATNKK